MCAMWFRLVWCGLFGKREESVRARTLRCVGVDLLDSRRHSHVARG